MTNILILSAGTRNKVVQAFKETIKDNGKIIATDCSNLAPAIYDADSFHIVPRITIPGYMDVVLELCKMDGIKGVFSLIDPELSMLAKDADRFREIGVIPVISPYDLVESCFDKYGFYKMMLKMGIPSARCFISKEEFFEAKEKGEISYPVFAKPRKGSASININKVTTDDEIEVLYKLYDDIMIQEYMSGQEYGADVYIDMISGKCTSMFVKKKIKMRAGETDKSISVKIPVLFDQIRDFVEKAGFRGMIDIDIFHDEEKDIFYFSEVNPRFGGGYPHAYACGVNMPQSLINNLEGKENPVTIGDYRENICMMKYNETAIVDFNGKEIIP
ncbi:MAG: ATP-grasp domain-containing protein [Lachnospiraceae bacterium]|nr:ATP-grasp domain-containing protein [Lachnospiraceae bacterium]